MKYRLQKAPLGKRLAAFVFDFTVWALLAVLCSTLVNAFIKFDAYYDQMNNVYAQYGEQYGVNVTMTEEEYNAMTQEEIDAMNVAYETMQEAVLADENVVNMYATFVQKLIILVAVSLLTATIVLEFAIPLALGNGQTLGKKLVNIGVAHKNGDKVTSREMFMRTFFGKFSVEIIIPAFIVMMVWFGVAGLGGIAILLGIAGTQAMLVLATPQRRAFHDMVSSTYVVQLNERVTLGR